MSQNFLVDPGVARRIVDLCRVEPGDTVIEVGPGLGALTGHLLQRANHVHAVELDRNLADRIGVEYGARPGFTLHVGDILRVSIRDLLPEGKAVLVGHLP